MKLLKKIFACFMLSFMLCTAGGVVYNTPVHATDLNDAVNKIQSESGSNMLGGTKNKVAGFSREITDIVGIVVMTAVICGGIFTAIKFKQAGDSPAEKARLKTALILEVACIIFLASYMAFVKFGFTNFNLFK